MSKETICFCFRYVTNFIQVPESASDFWQFHNLKIAVTTFLIRPKLA